MTLLTPQQTAIDTDPLEWISPQRSAAMLKAIPTGNPDIGFALLPAAGKDKPNLVSDLLRTKLQPRQPSEDEQAAATGWPVTARDYRLITARKVPLAHSIEELAADFDANVQPHQEVLAMVLTFQFMDSEMFAHDALAMVATYCELFVAKHGVTSLVVQHCPGEMLSECRPHVHLVAFARTHSLIGWGARPADMDEQGLDYWIKGWGAFKSVW